MHPAVSSSLSYGLVLHLLLLSTTHCCVAVAFGYRPESVYLERTFTSLTTRAFRRTCRPLRGRLPLTFNEPGVPLHSTPGFMLSPRFAGSMQLFTDFSEFP